MERNKKQVRQETYTNSKSANEKKGRRKAQKRKDKLRRKKKKPIPKKKSVVRKYKKKKTATQMMLRDLVIAGTIGTTGVLFFLSFFLSIVEVKGFSMMPTVRDGDQVLVEKRAKLKRFDVVVFSRGAVKPEIRRVIGLPGERIRYDQDTLLVDDEPITEKVIVDAINESQKNGKNFTEDFNLVGSSIPKNFYLVLGDNRPYGTDSRHYGLVRGNQIIGKVKMKLLPLGAI